MDTCINRLEKYFADLRKITASEVGITRLAFSDEEWQGRAYVRSIMDELGLEVSIDAFGNMTGRLPVDEKFADYTAELPVIMMGSHIDSVPQGGNYDGVVGVLSALEVVRYFKENGGHKYPLEVTVFSNEEGSRFGAATLGSRAMIGELTQAELDDLVDKNHISLRQALESRGLEPDKIGEPLYAKKIHLFLETHIEQGRVLEELDCPLGVVTGIAAPTRFKLKIMGRNDHSGATPMNMRQDALAGAAELVLAVEKYAQAKIDPPVVGTVGILNIVAGAMNVIPGEVELGIDIRSISAEAKNEVIEAVKKKINEICAVRNLEADLKCITDEMPVAISKETMQLLKEACQAEGISYNLMPSGAGHDAMNMAKIAPTGMLFIPCKEGISHNAAEWAKTEDVARAVKVLISAVKLA